MKRIDVRFMTTMLFLSILAAAGNAQTVKEANQLYRQGQYAQAAEAYQRLIEKMPDNPYLHYNLGNAVFKDPASGNLGRAIVEYLRAYRLNPRDPDIRYNLDFALKKTGESLVSPGMPKALHLLFHLLSEGELMGIVWIGYWLCLLGGGIYLAFPATQFRLKSWLTPIFIFWLISGAWWGLRRMIDIQNPGVIVAGNSEARSGPGMNFPVSFNAPEGRRVSILSAQGDWLEIGVLKEGLQGWVPAKAVDKI